MKRVVGFLVLAVLACALAVAVYQYRFVASALLASGRSVFLTQATIDEMTAWAARQSVAPGHVRTLALPQGLRGWAQGGNAAIAHLKDGRTCVLVVTVVGYKDNFDGVLACTGPLAKAEIVESPDYHRSYVSLPGYEGFEELYVRAQRNDRTVDVFFDLN